MINNQFAQFIRESQVVYPSISNTPFEVMEHLFYVLGNGYPYSSTLKNHYVRSDTNRPIPFHDYYNNQLSFSDLVEIIPEYVHNNKIEEMLDFLSRFECGTNDELYQKAVDQYNARYDNLILVDDYFNEDNFYNVKMWLELINMTTSPSPIYPSPNIKYDKDSNPELLKLYKVVTKASILWLEDHISVGTIDGYNNPYSFREMTEEDKTKILQTNKQTLDKLKESLTLLGE